MNEFTEKIEKMDYEEAYSALSAIVAKLEDPENKLEESIALYEQACILVLHCRRTLEKASLQITDINERIARMKNGQ